MSFRDMTAADIGAGLRLCRASGWNQIEADWRRLLAPPSVFRVAEAGDRVIGCAGAVVYGRDLAWVCMVLVDPVERGRGLGTVLVEQVLERLRSVAAVGLDATPSGRPVYARLGFAEAYGLARLELPAGTPGHDVADPSAQPLSRGDLVPVLAWDREVFGADRSGLLRDAMATAPQYAWLAGRESVDGYCLGRRGHGADQIGPIVARSEAAARALLAACLRGGGGRRVFVDAPDDGEWRADLAALGFREQRPFTRMYLRGAAPGRRDLRAIFGPEFG